MRGENTLTILSTTNGDGKDRWFPVTLWQTYTQPKREIRIIHAGVIVGSRDEALEWACSLNATASLGKDGQITLAFPSGAVDVVAHDNVRIGVYSGEPQARGSNSVPKPFANNGTGRLKTRIVNPFQTMAVLRELADIPGAPGPLDAVAIGARLSSQTEETPFAYWPLPSLGRIASR